MRSSSFGKLIDIATEQSRFALGVETAVDVVAWWGELLSIKNFGLCCDSSFSHKADKDASVRNKTLISSDVGWVLK